MSKTYPVTEKYIFQATDALLEKRLRARLANDDNPFTMKNILDLAWPPEYNPFYEQYGHLGKRKEMTAVQQMGKVFKKVCLRLGLNTRLVDDGKGHVHTEYFFPNLGSSPLGSPTDHKRAKSD